MSNSFGWPPHVGALRLMLKTTGSRPLTGFDVATNLILKMSSGGFGVGRHLDGAERAAFLGPFRNPGPRRRFHDLMGSVMAETDYLAGVEKALTTTLRRIFAATVSTSPSTNEPSGLCIMSNCSRLIGPHPRSRPIRVMAAAYES